MTEAERRAVEMFLTMQRHVTGCVPCQINEVAFDAATERHDSVAAQDLAHRFCPDMQLMAAEFAAITHEAFG